jgi:hypothetical protein
MSKVTISDFLLAVSDLIEAQSNALKQEWSGFFKEERKKLNYLSKNFAFYFVFAVLFVLGFSVFCFGLYKLLEKFMPDFIALFVISFIFFIAAFIFAKSIKNE